MKDDKDIEEMKQVGRVVERAIALVNRFVPVEDRAPIPGGGAVRVSAVGMLVALRAMIEALLEAETNKT